MIWERIKNIEKRRDMRNTAEMSNTCNYRMRKRGERVEVNILRINCWEYTKIEEKPQVMDSQNSVRD